MLIVGIVMLLVFIMWIWLINKPCTVRAAILSAIALVVIIGYILVMVLLLINGIIEVYG